MQKLKIILQSKYLYIILLIVSLTYVLINVFLIEKKSLYDLENKDFVLKIIDIKETQNGKTVVFKGKEKLISYFESEFLYSLGDIVEVKGTLQIPNKNTIPNLFDYNKYLHNQNIFYVLKVDNIELIRENKNFFNRIKTLFINKINNYKSKNYMYAFVLGNTSFINDNIKDKYLELGINHLFAISGMHVSMLIMIITFLLSKLRVNKYLIFTINSMFLIFYVFIVNFQVSIIRSVSSYILLSINKFFKLNIKTEYVIIFIFSVSLMINPFNIYNLGFQYSYLISYILIKFSFLINGNYFKKSFIISFLAFMGSIPLTIMNNYQINLLTVFYNIIYVPLISILIFPLALMCFVFPFLDGLFHYLTIMLENLTNLVSEYNLILIFRKPSLVVVMIYFIIIFYCINGLSRKKYHRFIYFIFLLFIHYNFNFIFKENYVLFFDVSQGDSSLIYLDGKSILIDTGGSFYKDYDLDLIEFMKSFGIKKINYLLLSHGDYDHMGEAINFVENFKVEKVIFNCGEFNELELALIKALDKKKIPYYSCIKKLNIDNNKLYFLNNKDYGNENDNSSVIYTKLNNYKFLFMGDASVEVEEDLIEKYNLQDIDVLKVGHHGSKTSSSKYFINKINPKYSIISVGKNNRYGHPNKEVLNSLKDAKIYRTDQDGSVMFKIKKNKFETETCTP